MVDVTRDGEVLWYDPKADFWVPIDPAQLGSVMFHGPVRWVKEEAVRAATCGEFPSLESMPRYDAFNGAYDQDLWIELTSLEPF